MPLHKGKQGPVTHFTTYDVAGFFQISAPTARKWITKGLISDCFQLPESNEWRVPANRLLQFAKDRHLPITDIMEESAALYEATYEDQGQAPKSASAPITGVAGQEDYANKVIEV